MNRITAGDISNIVKDVSSLEHVGFADIFVNSLWNRMLIRTEGTRERIKYPDKFTGNPIEAVHWLLENRNYYLANTHISYPLLSYGSDKLYGDLYKKK